MGKKIGVLIAALALGAMVAAPLAAAHLTASSLTLAAGVSYDGTTDKCRNEGTPVGNCAGSDGVSGTYRGNAAVWITDGTLPVFGTDPDGAGLPVVGNLFGPVCQGYVGPWGAYCASGVGRGCDTEWLSEGIFEGNEIIVEGDVAQVNGGGTIIPDGTWDDGGQGMVCHVSNGPGGFGGSGWNTAGCTDTLHAEDANPLMGNQVWIANACDTVTTIDGGDLFDCVVNEGVLGDNGVVSAVGALPDTSGVAPAVATITGCATDPDHGVQAFVAGTIAGLPVVGSPVAGTTECGTDAGADIATFGMGGGNGGAGVAAPTPAQATGGIDCTGAGNFPLQNAFIYNYVNLAPAQVILTVHTGWVDA